MATLEIKAEIVIPKVVNFLRLEDGQKIALSMIPDEDLKAVGVQYGENLVARKNELGAGRMKKRKEEDSTPE